MTNSKIETDLAEILTSINNKIDKYQDENRQEFKSIGNRLNKLEVSQAQLTTQVDNIEKEVKEIKYNQKTLSVDVSSLKGAKSLIVPIIVAVTTSILTLILRTIPNPQI